MCEVNKLKGRITALKAQIEAVKCRINRFSVVEDYRELTEEERDTKLSAIEYKAMLFSDLCRTMVRLTRLETTIV